LETPLAHSAANEGVDLTNSFGSDAAFPFLHDKNLFEQLTRAENEALTPCTLTLASRDQKVRYFFVLVALNDTPKRNEALRMRSGVRSIMRAASSSDFFALASSITRRLWANDQDLSAPSGNQTVNRTVR